MGLQNEKFSGSHFATCFKIDIVHSDADAKHQMSDIKLKHSQAQFQLGMGLLFFRSKA